jgi:hypothetical protein
LSATFGRFMIQGYSGAVPAWSTELEASAFVFAW